MGVHGVFRDGRGHVFSLQKVACAAALPMEAGNRGEKEVQIFGKNTVSCLSIILFV